MLEQLTFQAQEPTRSTMLTREQAITLAESEFWKSMDHRQIAEFQLNEDKLCMPFDVFHEAIEKSLDRPVFTHEFASQSNLLNEFYGEKSRPTFQEILDLIPEEKRIIVKV